MKLYAFFTVLILAAGTAAAEQSAVWAPASAAEILSAVDFPAAGTPLRALPRDGANYSGAEEVLTKEYSIQGITLDIPEEAVAAQTLGYPNSVCLEQALRLSLKSFLEDHTNPSGPLAAILAGMGASTEKPSKAEVKNAGRKLFQLMNMAGSTLALVRSAGPWQAARGETVNDNWVFHLRLASAARSYWAVTDRSGRKAVYNY